MGDNELNKKVAWQIICNNCSHRWIRSSKGSSFIRVSCPECGSNESLSAREKEK